MTEAHLETRHCLHLLRSRVSRKDFVKAAGIVRLEEGGRAACLEGSSRRSAWVVRLEEAAGVVRLEGSVSFDPSPSTRLLHLLNRVSRNFVS